MDPLQWNDDQSAKRESKWLRKATGWGLLIAGIAGCILPILPGFPLVIAGLIVLAQDYLWAKHAVGKTKRWAVQLRRKARARKARAGAAGAVRRKGVEEI